MNVARLREPLIIPAQHHQMASMNDMDPTAFVRANISSLSTLDDLS
jgi:hypothetical protein